jgi:hypothetical protein
MLLKTSLPPKLRRETTIKIAREATMALRGSGVELMLVSLVNHLGNGKPSSRAKDHACRDAAAVELMVTLSDTIKTGIVIPMAPAVLPVATAKISTNGYGAADPRICCSTSWMEKQ